MIRLYSILLLLVLSFSAKAQQYFFEEGKTFSGGLAFGVNFSQVDGDQYKGYNKVGFNLGPVVYARLANEWGASLELNYNQKGSKVRRVTQDPAVGTYVEKYYMKLNYVEMPFLLHYTPADKKYHFSAGASYSYLISYKESGGSLYAFNFDKDLYSFKNTDINGIIGAAYRFYDHWYIEGRYAYSLMTIRAPQRVPPGWGAGNQFNNLFSLKLLYLF